MKFGPLKALFLEINPFRVIGQKPQPPGTLLNMIFQGVATVSVLNLAE
jgi:hypothetical protein